MKSSKKLSALKKIFSPVSLLIFLLVLFSSSSIISQSWTACNPGPGTNGHTFALCIFNGKLIMGGDFTTAGGIAASHIAAWDGVTWTALGTGVNGRVRVLYVYNNQLIAGGGFTIAGGKTVNHIARWNGTVWDSLGSGTSDTVYALNNLNSNLVAGGSFLTAGGIDCKRIASWNGTSWSSLGSGAVNGLNNAVLGIEVVGSTLYAGGRFTLSTSGVNTKRIASWDGSTWSAVGTGIDNGTVNILYWYTNVLIVGGSFTTINGAAYGHIAQWNGTSYLTMGTGVDGVGLVNSLRPLDGILYIGGDFPDAGGVLGVNNICRWNGSVYTSMLNGVESGGSIVEAIALYQGLITVAGSFATTASGVTVNNIAKWGLPPTDVPVLLAPPNGSIVFTRTPLLQWYRTHWAGRYFVQVSLNSNFNTTVVNDSSSTGQQFSVPSGILQLNTQYFWRVAGWNPLGRGPFSAVWSFNVANIPAAPSLVSPPDSSVVPNTTPVLTWTSSGGAFYYGVQVAADAGFNSMVINDSTLSFVTYTVAGGILQQGQTYFWRAYAYNPLGRSPNSQTWRFTVQGPTGIINTGNGIPKEFNLYQNFPNPFNPSTVIKFDIPVKSDVKLIVYDLLGREAAQLVNGEMNAGRYEITWNAGNLASGIYYYKLTSGKEVFTKKLILVK
jgi:hypothetical protein